MSSILRFCFMVFALLVSAPLSAGSHKPAFGGDFTFKSLKPPAAGTRKRITVRVSPEEWAKQKAAPAQDGTEPPEDTDTQVSHLSWFWDEISPAAGTPVAGRFLKAVDHVVNDPSNSASPPRLDDLTKIANAHGIDILRETIDTDLSPALVLSVIAVESGGRADATSSAGAEGLMQLIPDTASRFGVTDSFNPAQNIKGGVAYLQWLMREFDGDPILALAGYNAGEGAVRKYAGVPPFAETRAYVPKVLAAWRIARSTCLTPPLLVGDGCVFRRGG